MVFSTMGLIIVPVLLFFFVLIFVVRMLKRCGPEEILIISGAFRGSNKGKAATCIHGGCAFVLPLFQQWTKLSLTPFSTEVNLKGALSKNNIRVNIPSTFTIAISPEEHLMEAAAQRLVGLSGDEIEKQANEIIFGQLRAAIATMTIEQINADRDAFMNAVEENVNTELNKIGLRIINVNITDITDESGYIAALGKKAASEAINRAFIDVAEQEKKGQIGVETANRERVVEVSNQKAISQQGTKKAEMEQRVATSAYEAQAVEGENKAMAMKAEYDASLAEKQAESKQRAFVARANADKTILEAEKLREQTQQERDIIVKQEIEKRQRIIAAEAEAGAIRLKAQAEADAKLMQFTAEAEGTQKVLQAKAKGYEELFKTVGEQKHLVPTMELVKQLPEIVRIQVEAISQLKIDKITVWDSGTGNSGKTTTANFLSGMISSLPAVHELAKQAGVKLPDFMGSLEDKLSGGLVGAKGQETVLGGEKK